MRRTLTTILCFAAVVAPVMGQRPPEIVTYYQQWLGCKAPPIQFDRSDRSNFAERDYRGKKVLLYGLNSGDFANSPDMEQLVTELRELAEVRKQENDPFRIICYTRGLVLAGKLAAPLTEEVASLTQFPWVNLNNKHGDNALGEPYELLHNPGGILIGTNGIICRIYSGTMRKDDFLDAAHASAWTDPVRTPPTQTADELWQSIPKTAVIVAWRNLTAGEVLLPYPRTIAADLIPNSRLPKDTIPRQEFRNIMGATVTTNIAAREPLTWSILDTSTVNTNLVPTKRSTTTPVPLRSTGEGER
jgi:hypothetical protein